MTPPLTRNKCVQPDVSISIGLRYRMLHQNLSRHVPVCGNLLSLAAKFLHLQPRYCTTAPRLGLWLPPRAGGELDASRLYRQQDVRRPSIQPSP